MAERGVAQPDAKPVLLLLTCLNRDPYNAKIYRAQQAEQSPVHSNRAIRGFKAAKRSSLGWSIPFRAVGAWFPPPGEFDADRTRLGALHASAPAGSLPPPSPR